MHQPTDDEELIGEEVEQRHGATHNKQYVCFCGGVHFEILLCTECEDTHIVALRCTNKKCGTIHQSMVAYTYDELYEVRH